MQTENTLELVQKPIINHKLKEVGKQVRERIAALELDKQVATEETLKSLKDTRATLNKELDAIESQRKAIKTALNEPYDAFAAEYKTEITDEYSKAILLCKNGIDFVENKIKDAKKESVKSYFEELCLSEKIYFYPFNRAGIEINLSTTEKKYREKCIEIVNQVKTDLQLIASTDFEAEILAEYKVTLVASESIIKIKTRKESEAEEARLLAEKAKKNRIEYLEKEGFKYDYLTKSYAYNDDIYVLETEVETLSKTDFSTKFNQVIAEIKALAALVFEAPKVEEIAPKTAVSESQLNKQASPTQEPIRTASFEVKATLPVLRALAEYMKQNNIEYKNL